MKINQKRLEKGLWWDKNWGVLEGCSPASPGCNNCFAASYAHRFQKTLPYLQGLTTEKGKFNGTVRFREDQLDLPLRTKKPTVFFVAERSDLFHDHVSLYWRDSVVKAISCCPQHTFLMLTKRPENMLRYFEGCMKARGGFVFPQNLWLGVTAENHDQADQRIPILLRTPAAKRFVSVEPILGPVNLTRIFTHLNSAFDALTGRNRVHGLKDYNVLDWVICGGESGSGARPMHPDWVRSLRDQCKTVGVPFFFKQWGEWAPTESLTIEQRTKSDQVFICEDGTTHTHADSHEWNASDAYMYRVGKKAAGRLLDGVEHLEVPE